MDSLLTAVRERVTPSDAEVQSMHRLSQRLLRDVRKTAPGEVEPLLVGSVAKGTWLPGADLDLFLRFPPGTDLAVEGLTLARRLLPEGVELYAQHPYLRGEIDSTEIDVVPCLAVADGASPESAVDRTPFHTAWVRERITPTSAGEVRLAKRFLQGVGAYGAAAAVGGFSGYLVEILVLRYGGFRAWLELLAGWQPPVELGVVPGAPATAVTLPDPVDSARNVAAGVTRRTLGLAVLAARAFLANPGERYFFPPHWTPATEGCTTTLRLPPTDEPVERALPRLQRHGRRLARLLEPFGVLGWHASVGTCPALVFETATRARPVVELHRGPEPWGPGALEFLAHHPTARLGAERLEVARRVRHRTVAEVMRTVLPEAEIVETLPEEVEPIPALPWLARTP